MNPIEFRDPNKDLNKDIRFPKEAFRPIEKVEERRQLKKDSKGSGQSKEDIDDDEGVTFEKVLQDEIQESSKEKPPRKQSLFDLTYDKTSSDKPKTLEKPEGAGILKTLPGHAISTQEEQKELPPAFAPFLEKKEEKEKKAPLTRPSSPFFSLARDEAKETEKVSKEKPPVEAFAAMQALSHGPVEVPLPNPANAAKPAYYAEKIKKIEEIVAQIAANLYTVEHKGVTTTVVELKHPPLFEGAFVSLTTEPGTPGPTLTFENLRPEAKLFLDEKLAKETLQSGLKAEGIVLYRIVTTTEPPAIYPGKADSKEGRQKGRDFDDENDQPLKQ